ncbi:RDD family protein [Enterococcus hermanniensis]|uniref:RDD domain-containing protein n=1 Tax=Enterococcus hermanniensis TaxID=249189 RepID=A0A1L8TG84_9ENTE|nr:RDD family protein [Enterococcus hermanniensis]OJG43277.1 hypothetical protein RV04_GL000722 [Enterococcus hermanniensis]
MGEESSYRPAVGPIEALLKKDQQKNKFHHYPNYFYAGFWIRLFAYLVDLLCITAIQTIILGLPAYFIGWDKSSELTTIYGGLALVIYLGYFIVMTKINQGQTIGKMIFGIQVVCFNEATLSWKTIFVREGACRFILRGSLFMLGYLVTIFTPNKQHIGDYFSDTSVVTINVLAAREELYKNETDRISE